MSLRVVARLLNRSPSVIWRAVQALDLKPYRVGTTLNLTWADISQLELYLSTRKRYGTHLH